MVKDIESIVDNVPVADEEMRDLAKQVQEVVIEQEKDSIATHVEGMAESIELSQAVEDITKSIADARRSRKIAMVECIGLFVACLVALVVRLYMG